MANSPRLAELADLITRREYNFAMCKARKHTEDLVRRYALDHSVEYTTLADTIEALYEAGVINDVSRENLHGIRILGNKAVHQDDNDAQDAKSAYEMLKKELGTYSDQKYTNPERTPVAISRDTTAEEYGVRRRHREEQEEQEGEIDVSYASGGRRSQSSSQSSRNSGKKKKSSGESTLYTVLKILIPVLIIVLLVVLIKSIFTGSGKAEETTEVTTEAAVEEETTEAPTTEAPTTEAPTTEPPTTEAPETYEISGNGVNIRLASDPTQKYTQLSEGTFIGPVTDYENKTGDPTFDGFARFAYDGKDVIVSKKYIRKTTSNE